MDLPPHQQHDAVPAQQPQPEPLTQTQPEPQSQPEAQPDQTTQTQHESSPSTAAFMCSNSRSTALGPKLTKNNILEEIKDFDSSIPDPVVHHFLNYAGMQTSDQRVIRLIAIAAQKFIHDIVSDSLQHCKLRGAQGKKTKEKKLTLGIEDLAAALEEYGIEIKRQQYFN